MKKILGIVLAVCVASGAALFAGCGQKETQKTAVAPEARQLLVQGTVDLKQGEVVKAVQNFALAIKTAPDYFEAYYMLAETFIHLKQFPQAQAVLTGAVSRFPENPVVYYLLAAAYEGSGNMMPAIIAARKSVDLFQAKQDEDGTKRAVILLGALVQAAKEQSEKDMVNNAAQDAVKAVTTNTVPAGIPAVAQ
jgi:predicted Zn-dependent protease